MFVFLNEKIIKKKDFKLSPFDRGLLYGESVFETILIEDNNIFDFQKHLNRLENGAKELEINFNYSDKDVEKIIKELQSKNNLKNAICRITLTKGVGERRGLSSFQNFNETFLITISKFDGYTDEIYAKGYKVIISSYEKIDRKNLPQGIKHGNYLQNIYAYKEAENEDANEAILLDRNGNITEATMANIFWKKDNVFYTPSIKLSLLPGIMRSKVIKFLKSSGEKILEGEYSLKELFSADEIFLTSSVLVVMPIIEISDKWKAKSTNSSFEIKKLLK